MNFNFKDIGFCILKNFSKYEQKTNQQYKFIIKLNLSVLLFAIIFYFTIYQRFKTINVIFNSNKAAVIEFTFFSFEYPNDYQQLLLYETQKYKGILRNIQLLTINCLIFFPALRNIQNLIELLFVVSTSL